MSCSLRSPVAAALDSCPEELLVSDFLQVIAEIGIEIPGLLRTGSPPAPANGPVLTAPPNVTAVNGGSARVRVTADRPFSTIFVTVESSGPTPVGGFFEVTLPQPAVDALLQLVLSPDVAAAFRCLFRVGDSAAIGPVAATDVNVTRVASGDVQVGLAWFVDADLDLHVIEPSREGIFWADTSSESGRVLDLDSICDGVRNGNVAWPDGPAPAGHYVVRVEYLQACRVTEPVIDYVVTLQRAGRPPEAFEGCFTERETVTVTEFDH